MRKVFFALILLVPTLSFSRPILMIGDSVFALSGGVAKHLKNSGYSVTDKSRVAAKMPSIATQYTTNKSSHEVVVMDGGGNDILLGHRADCISQNDKCRSAVRAVIGAVKSLMNRMERDGIERVIYVGLYHLRGRNRLLNPAIDAGMLQAEIACSMISICEFVDSRDFMIDSDILFDDLHPNSSGSRKIGEAVSAALQEYQTLL